jgi:arsenate reductase/arsenic resistance protein ArsH
LAVIEAAGYKPDIIEYTKTGWEETLLRQLLKDCDLTPKQALRTSKSPAKELGLMDDGVSDETIFAAMLEHPILVNRSIVVTNKGAKLCRPSETVLDILDKWPPAPFYKEDGSLMIDESGNRV